MSNRVRTYHKVAHQLRHYLRHGGFDRRMSSYWSVYSDPKGRDRYFYREHRLQGIICPHTVKARPGAYTQIFETFANRTGRRFRLKPTLDDLQNMESDPGVPWDIEPEYTKEVSKEDPLITQIDEPTFQVEYHPVPTALRWLDGRIEPIASTTDSSPTFTVNGIEYEPVLTEEVLNSALDEMRDRMVPMTDSIPDILTRWPLDDLPF